MQTHVGHWYEGCGSDHSEPVRVASVRGSQVDGLDR
jgi:hypothetical protein